MFFKFPSALQGALLALFAFTVFASADAINKISGLEGISPYMISLLSAWGASAVVLISILVRKKVANLMPKKWKWHIVRSAIGLALAVVSAISFKNLPMTSAYIGLFASPMIISLFGARFMGERLGPRRLAGIILGFIGVLIALFPDMFNGSSADFVDQKLGYIALLAFVGLYVADCIILRFLGHTESTESLSLIPYACRAIVMLPVLFFTPLSTVSLESALWLVGMGGLLGIASICITLAYKFAPVAIVSPFHYTQLISGGIYGYLLWNHIPSIWVWIGGVLIVASSVLTARAAQRYTD